MSPHRPDPPTSDRRCGLVPPSVSGELLRLRLVESLWPAAGTSSSRPSWPGPGWASRRPWPRSIRHHHAHPRGVDAWVSCEPGDEDADHLADAIVRALGATLAGSDAAVRGDQRAALDVTAGGVPRHRRRPRAPGRLVGRHAARRRGAGPPGPRPPRAGRANDAGAAAGPAARRRAGRRHHPGVPGVHRRRGRRAVAAGRAATRRPGRRSVAGRRSSAWPSGRRAGTPDRAGAGSSCGRRSSAGSVPTTCGPCWRWPRWGRPTPRPWPRCAARRSTSTTWSATVPMVAHTGDGRIRAHDLWHGTLTLDRARRPTSGTMGRAAAEHLLAAGSYVRAGSLAARLGDTDVAVRRGAGAGPQHAVGAARGHRGGLAPGGAGAPATATRAGAARGRDAATPRVTTTPRSMPWSPRRSRRSAPAATTSASRRRSASGSCWPTPGVTCWPCWASSTRPLACPASTQDRGAAGARPDGRGDRRPPRRRRRAGRGRARRRVRRRPAAGDRRGRRCASAGTCSCSPAGPRTPPAWLRGCSPGRHTERPAVPARWPAGWPGTRPGSTGSSPTGLLEHEARTRAAVGERPRLVQLRRVHGDGVGVVGRP